MCRAGAAAAWLAADPNRERGEYVLVVAAESASAGQAQPQSEAADAGSATVEVAAPCWRALLEELPVSRAVRIAERATGAAAPPAVPLALSLKLEPTNAATRTRAGPVAARRRCSGRSSAQPPSPHRAARRAGLQLELQAFLANRDMRSAEPVEAARQLHPRRLRRSRVEGTELEPEAARGRLRRGTAHAPLPAPRRCRLPVVPARPVPGLFRPSAAVRSPARADRLRVQWTRRGGAPGLGRGPMVEHVGGAVTPRRFRHLPTAAGAAIVEARHQVHVDFAAARPAT